MRDRFQRWLPRPEALASNRWLRWLGPGILHPRLWHVSRRGIALGCAIGVFFGLLIPVAQIPVAAVFAVACRANIAAAVGSTLVTNPVTFGPVYYAAWRLGHRLLGGKPGAAPPPLPVGLVPADGSAPQSAPSTAPVMAAGAPSAPVGEGTRGWLARTGQQLGRVGKPLALGLAIFASGFGVLVWLLVNGLWWLLVQRKRRQRQRQRLRRA